jgi:ABC-type polar amino acid transport system ATPase subunit
MEVTQTEMPSNPAGEVLQQNDAVLVARGLHKSFGGTLVLDQVDFSIRRGETVVILGPSGSGKTTLLRCLNLLVEPSEGELFFRGESVGAWPGGIRKQTDLSKYRSHVAMVFQQFELFPHLTACQNVSLGPRKVLRLPNAAAEERALALLERVGLKAYANARPRTLSGGQQQRVAIARALAMSPDVILFDEPTSALDWEMVGEVLDIMADLARQGMTMVVVTHELEFARTCADRVIVMEKGRILEEGTSSVMFESPTVPRSREILGLARQQPGGPSPSPSPPPPT